MQFELLSTFAGTLVKGVEIDRISETERQVLQDTLAERGVLVFPDQSLTPKSFAEAIGQFGELMQQSSTRFAVSEYPIVGYVSNRDKATEGGPVIVRGEQYHTDHSNHPAPPMATILYGVEIPSRGGDTQFVNVQAAYDDLPPTLKAEIDGLSCRHVGQSSRSPRLMTSAVTGEARPETLQPIVTVHPLTGRKGLYLNTARMEDIPGLSDEEAGALIERLMDHATQPKYEYRHKWKKGDVVIWDNRVVLHQANGDVPKEEYRLLYRLMIKGQPLQPAA